MKALVSNEELRVVLADDEAPAREYLASLIGTLPGLSLARQCANGREAVEAVRAEKPDLLFLDVQMPELDGFAVLTALGDDVPPGVIFVTAYDQHAVRAFEVHALDYLLKPFGPERFQKAVSRAREILASPEAAEIAGARLRELGQPGGSRSPFLHRLLISHSGRIHFRQVSELDFVEAEGNYLRLHFGAESYLQRDKISALAARLDPVRFARPHRSFLVNIDRIRELRRSFHGEFIVVLKNGREFPLGKPYREAFLEQVSGGGQ